MAILAMLGLNGGLASASGLVNGKPAARAIQSMSGDLTDEGDRCVDTRYYIKQDDNAYSKPNGWVIGPVHRGMQLYPVYSPTPGWTKATIIPYRDYVWVPNWNVRLEQFTCP
ncbi:hypothetical protein [Kibdelosporangium phytohabitans]|uniref:hypothetical protein n=1 Tax=Kibdelosporangium phytohabitans TaxID=860235 RepID=UPI0012F97CFB|nr:hypothetical protein [Kibdelosporangium phytohabitans]MBE1467539.1 hypothetical protein [Kibdelosporangium phytohabitans]